MYQESMADAVWDPETDDWLKFVPLNKAIDLAIPTNIAVFDVTASNALVKARENDGMDSNMLFFKGIMYAALSQMGAKEAFYVCTDDIPLDLYVEPGTYREGSYGWKLSDIYQDSAQHDSWYHISHEESCESGGQTYTCGYDYHVANYRNIFVTSDGHWVHLVWIQMEAEGGPPGDWFFVKGDKLKVESV